MSGDRFVLDIIAEAQTADGVWVECDDPGAKWESIRCCVRPLTTGRAETIKRRLNGTKDLNKISKLTMDELLVGIEGMGVGDREATLAEAISYLHTAPRFLNWLVDKSNALVHEFRESVEADLGN
jgi:hypothetical protein